MPYRRLFVLCEGDDDERFFERVFATLLDHDDVQYYQYAQQTSRAVRGMIQSIRGMDAEREMDVECIYLCDFDRSECIISKKREITNKYINLDPEEIFVVKETIEGWYVAGLQEDMRNRLGISSLPRRTDDLLKEHFNNALPRGEPRISIMREILDTYDLAVARQRNYSIDYFCSKIF